MRLLLDTAVLVVLAAGPPAAEPRTDRGLDARWAALGSGDARVSYEAMAALVARPAEAVRFLRRRLRPVAPPDPAHLSRLIGELDNNRFAVRDRATHDLERLGEPAEAALRRALEHRPSPERRRRIEQILETHKRERLQPPPDDLRRSRAVEVLEQIGTPAARQLLATLAEGAPEAGLTREARGALERLARSGP